MQWFIYNYLIQKKIFNIKISYLVHESNILQDSEIRNPTYYILYNLYTFRYHLQMMCIFATLSLKSLEKIKVMSILCCFFYVECNVFILYFVFLLFSCYLLVKYYKLFGYSPFFLRLYKTKYKTSKLFA